MLKLIAMAIASADKAKVPIAVCGEMAGDPQLTRLLLGLGLRNLSMHPAQLLTIKQRVLTSDVGRARAARRAHAAGATNPAKLVAQLDKLNPLAIRAGAVGRLVRGAFQCCRSLRRPPVQGSRRAKLTFAPI